MTMKRPKIAILGGHRRRHHVRHVGFHCIGLGGLFHTPELVDYDAIGFQSAPEGVHEFQRVGFDGGFAEVCQQLFVYHNSDDHSG